MLLYKCLRIEGILSPYANPFYPAMETKQDTIEIEVQKERKTEKVNKAEIASKLQVNVNNIQLKEEQEYREEWIEVKHEVPQASTPNTSKTLESDSFKVLREIEDDKKEMEEAMQKEKVTGKRNEDRTETNIDVKMDGNKDTMKDEVNKDFNVNTMKLEDIEEMIRKVKNDNKLHALENDTSLEESISDNESEQDVESIEEEESKVNMDNVAELLKEQEIEIQLKTGENSYMKKTIEELEKELSELRSGKFKSQNEPEKDAKDKLKTQEMTRLKIKTEANFFVEVYDMQMKNIKLLDEVKKLEKENGHLNVKYKDIKLLYEKTDRDLRDRDIWVEDMVEEIRNESRRKE